MWLEPQGSRPRKEGGTTLQRIRPPAAATAAVDLPASMSEVVVEVEEVVVEVAKAVEVVVEVAEAVEVVVEVAEAVEAVEAAPAAATWPGRGLSDQGPLQNTADSELWLLSRVINDQIPAGSSTPGCEHFKCKLPLPALEHS